jgi:hypothetical protein
MPTRRDLLQGGAAAGVAMLLPATLLDLAATPAEAAPTLLYRSTFEKCRDLRYDIVGGQFTGVPLSLAGVRDLPGAADLGIEGHEEAFSVRFTGPLTTLLAQGTYGFRNRALGRLSLFLVPAGESKGRAQYDALFNRITA